MGIRYEGNFKVITGLYNTSIVTTIAWDSPAAGDLGHYNGFANFNFSPVVTVSGISTGTVFSLASGELPAGTTLNPATGDITGVLEGTAATYNFTIRVTDNGVSADRAFYMSVDEVTHVSWVSPAAGALGASAGGSSYSFSSTVQVFHPIGSTVFTVASGTLPAGTNLNAVTGAITGTLTNEASNYEFTIRATNNNTYSDRTFTGSVTATTVVSWNGPTAGARGASAGNDTYIFAANTSVIHGVGNTTYSVITGTLPAGTELDPSTGIISGTLTNSASDYSYTIRATNNGSYADRAFTGSVTATTVVTWNGPAAGAQGASNGGTSYSLAADTSVVNAVGSTTYSVSAGQLPDGTNLNSSTGEVTGTLTNADSSYSFTIRATNNGKYADRTFAGTVVAVTVVTWNSPAAGSLGTALGNSSYSFTPSVSVVNPTGSTVYSVSAGTLPTGTILNSSTGAVTGTLPNTDFDYGFTIRATNNGVSSDRAFTGSVAAVVLSWNSPTAGALGASAGGDAYSFISNVSVTSGVGSAGSFAFNGSSRLSVPGGLITGNFAMEAWVKPTSGGSCTIFSDGAYMAGSSLMVFLNGGGVYVNSGSAGGNIVNGVGSTPLDTWSHIAWERIGTTNTIYVNGSAVTTFSYGGQFGASGFAIGSTTAGQYGFFGNISGIRLVTSAIYNGNFSAPTAPPSAITNTVLLLKATSSATLLSDASGLNTTVTNSGTTWSSSSPFTPMVFSIPTGAVPAGTSLDTATGIISGTLTNAAADYSFTVRATVNGVTADRSFTGSVTLTVTYAVSPSVTSVDEGNAVTFTVTTYGVANATTLYWTNNGTTSAADFSDSNNSGSFTITNNSGTFTRTLSADLTTEGGETLIAQIRTVSTSGTVVATANTVTVNDTSVAPAYTYAISPSVTSVDEGNSVTYTVTTTGVANATTLYYTNNGTTSAADFTESGAIVLNGSNQYLSIASPTASVRDWATSSYTIEYWIKPTSFNQGGNSESTVVGNMGYNNTSTYWSFGPVNSGAIKFYYYNGSPNALTTSATISTNVWTHLAFVNNAGSLTIYINGVSSVTGSKSGTPITGADLPFVVGSSNSSYFNGSISNLRITNRAVYTANFTPSTGQLTAVANTSLLLTSATSGTLVTDTSTNNYTVTNNGTATFNANGPFGDGTSVVINNNTGSFTKILSADVATEGSETIIMNLRTTSTSGTIVATANTVTVNDTSAQPVTTYAISPNVTSVNEGNTVVYTVTTAGVGVTDGTSLYWTNNGTTNAADFTEGGSIAFTGNGQYVSVPSNAAFAFSGDFTVEAWIYITPGSGLFNVFNVGGAAAGSYSLYWNNATSKFDSTRYGTAGGTTTNTYATGQWMHVAAVRASGTAKLYINGVADAGATFAMPSISASTNVRIGLAWGTSYNQLGYISNLRVVSGTALYTANFTPSTTPLTAVTNTALLLNNKSSTTAFTDSSTNAFTLTNSGTSFSNTNPFAGGSITFSSPLSNYLQVTTDAMAGDFTVEAWVNLTGLASTQVILGIDPGWEIWVTTTGTLAYYGSGYRIQTALAITANTWNHIALVRQGSTTKMYINGVADTNTYASAATLASQGSYIGRDNGSNGGLTGKITNLRIVNGTAIYTANFTPPTAQLTAVANTSLLLNAASSTTMSTDSSTSNKTVTVTGTPTWSPFSPVSSSLTNGSFKVYSNSATITRTLRNDLATEGSESLILNVRTTSTSGTVVATANTVTVNDTSRGPVTASYLLVAGGGGGAVNSAHGGGAGGLLSGTSALTAGTTYSVVVGTGGLGGVATAGASIASGNSGTNSTFAGLTAIGGGYGGAYNVAGGSGGSGGGGATAGTGTAGQGNNGGTGSATLGNPAGGGGAGAVGGNFSGGTFPTSGTGGAGGAGLASDIITTAQATTYSIGQVSGGQVWFAGGGGGCGDTRGANGGAGGLGGGGSGTKVASANGGSGLPASGGGGGGAAYYSTPQGNGGAGGSGVVIISVPTADYSGIVTGSPTVVTNGSNTVIIFKVNGSYTA